MPNKPRKRPSKTAATPSPAAATSPDAVRSRIQASIAGSVPEAAPTSTYQLCRTMLQVSVPLRMAAIQERGGATAADFARIATYGEEFAGEQGVYLLYRSPKPGVTARLFNHLCDAIAVLAFVPGGITSFGDHYEETSSPSAPPSPVEDAPAPSPTL